MRQWLREVRENKQLSQDNLAKQAGISQNYYSTIETGVRGDKLPVETAKAIAKVLGFNWTRFYEQIGEDDETV